MAKKRKKSLTGFPLADKALGVTVGGVTTGMAKTELARVGGVATYGQPMMSLGMLKEAMPKKKKRR